MRAGGRREILPFSTEGTDMSGLIALADRSSAAQQSQERFLEKSVGRRPQSAFGFCPLKRVTCNYALLSWGQFRQAQPRTLGAFLKKIRVEGHANYGLLGSQ